METFAADLLESVQDIDDRHPSRKPSSLRIDDDADRGADLNVAQDTQSGVEVLLKNSSLRVRLDRLSGMRIHADSITFTLSEPHCGGKAEVAKATLKRGDGSDEQQVAVKKLRYHDDINEGKFGNEFVHEVDVMAQLSHENIAQLIGFVEDLEKGKAWIVLSWEPNGSVSEFLATSECEIPERISLIQDTFAGIEYLHTLQPPICHGDLKSLNILVSASYRAVITDFGSARILKEGKERQEDRDKVLDAAEASAVHQETDERIDRTRITVVASNDQLTLTGPAWSLRWAAPEVALGEPQSLASDVWAAGWICWEVMTNKVPFPELNSEGAIVLKVVEGQVPAAREDTQLSQVIRLCSLMTDCWAFDPRSRPNISRCHREVRWMPSVRPLERKTPGSSVPSTKLLLQMGCIHSSQSRFGEAITLFEQALSIATSTGDQATSAVVLLQLGGAYYKMSKYDKAEEHVARAQSICIRIGDEIGQAKALQRRGRIYFQQDNLTESERSHTQARNIYARHGNAHGQAMTTRALGNISYKRSQYLEAEECYKDAINICTSIGAEGDHAATLLRLGGLFVTQFKYAKAEESLNRALGMYSRLGKNLGLANVKYALADLYHMQGLNAKAAPLYAEAGTIFAQIGDSGLAEQCSHWLYVMSKEGDSSITSEVSVLVNDDVPPPTH